jgi:hypothetical protein
VVQHHAQGQLDVLVKFLLYIWTLREEVYFLAEEIIFASGQAIKVYLPALLAKVGNQVIACFSAPTRV